ncbi:MAG TPA: zf-HC2 domain-containing protein [Anaeromyxobacter sp.]|nr:zf-HC2 domain-containing protein [Anaeromyxobacter sp.]
MNTLTGHLTDAQAQRLLDGALLPAEAVEVEAHAAGCEACAVLVDSYRELALSLDALPAPELPADFTAGVLERVARRERTVARERRAAAAVVVGALLALAVAVIAGGGAAWIPAATRFADQLGDVAHALRLGAEVLPSLWGVLRLPVAVTSAALCIPLLLALSRFIPSPRTEAH